MSKHIRFKSQGQPSHFLTKSEETDKFNGNPAYQIVGSDWFGLSHPDRLESHPDRIQSDPEKFQKIV